VNTVPSVVIVVRWLRPVGIVIVSVPMIIKPDVVVKWKPSEAFVDEVFPGTGSVLSSCVLVGLVEGEDP
jgi:hypothetical protein